MAPPGLGSHSARRGQLLVLVVCGTVLATELDERPEGRLAKVGAIDQEALATADEAQSELTDWGVRDSLKGGAQTAADGFDLTLEVDVDLTV